MNWQTRCKRIEAVKEAARTPNTMFGRCRVIGCRNAARAGSGEGLDRRFCRQHADNYSRHGDPYRGSIPASVINGYRRTAMRWLNANAGDLWVGNAIARAASLMKNAGPHVEAFRLRGLTPTERGKACFARLRKAEIDPKRIVAAWLAVELAIANDPAPVSTREFKQVQAAKLVHRLASGSHKRWVSPVERPLPGHPKVRVTELHVYPHSRGRVLRHIGRAIEGAVELLLDHHLAAIVGSVQRRG
jgi:hypothetical protein